MNRTQSKELNKPVMRCILFVFTLSLPLLTVAQDKQNRLMNKIHEADSVLLVSHQEREGSDEIRVDSAGNEIPYPKLLMDGKPNYQIIKEKTSLTGKQLDTLGQILLRPCQDRLIAEGKCFQPHHTIFLLKNDTTSFIDICFSCRHYETTADLERLPLFDNRRWGDLKAFFLKHGIKYELNAKKK